MSVATPQSGRLWNRTQLGPNVLKLVIVMMACLSCTVAAAQVPGSGTKSQSRWQRVVEAQRWVFLGDSNTYAGGYVALLDAWFTSADLETRPQLLNLGVSSETASGLSEVDHPFKRPCVHERLRKVLEMTRPDVVFICYGMNDGIYQPETPETIQAYKDGMQRLALAVKASGARLICLTPPIFEPEPVRAQGKLGPAKSGRYAYFAPAPEYNLVLESQTNWLLENEIGADLVIDVHSMLASEKAERLLKNPEFAFTRDGVHFENEAHALLAEKILIDLEAPQTVIAAYPNDETIQKSRQATMLRRDAYLAATGKNRPRLAPGLPIWLVEKSLAE